MIITKNFFFNFPSFIIIIFLFLAHQKGNEHKKGYTESISKIYLNFMKCA